MMSSDEEQLFVEIRDLLVHAAGNGRVRKQKAIWIALSAVEAAAQRLHGDQASAFLYDAMKSA